MAKQSIIASIDVGTTKICTIIAERRPQGLLVVGVGITPSNGMHKGMVVNLNEAKQSIIESVKKAEQVCGYRVESAYVGVTGRHVSASNNRGVISITRNDRLVRSEDLKRVLQSAHVTKVPGDRKLLHVIPRGYAVDGQSGVKNPVGMHGFRLDVETHVITAAVASVQNLAKCIRGVGIDVEELVLEPLASSEAVLTEEEKQVGVVLADIGGGTTDISIFKDGSIWHTAVIPVAGYQFTRDIALGLGLPFDMAEQMKKEHGSVVSVRESKMDAGHGSGDNGHTAAYQNMCEILRSRAEELLRLIVLELPRAEYQTLVPAGLVLTGGSSNLAGLEVMGSDILRLPVRIGMPINMEGISEELRDPAYATAVGLLLWGEKNHGIRPVKQVHGPMFADSIKKLLSGFRGLFVKPQA